MSRKEIDYTLDDACLDFSLKHGARFKDTFKNLEDVMSKSVFTEDFERRNELPKEILAGNSKRKVKEKIVKLPDEIAQDVAIIKMRSVLDPKRFYKKDKTISASHNVQIGKVIDSPIDFYNSRLPNKQRKSTLVDELLADTQFRQYNKRRFLQITDDFKRPSRSLRKYKTLIAKDKIKRDKVKRGKTKKKRQ